VGIGIAVLFFAENYATTYGLGYFVMNSWVMINYPLMFAGIMALGISAALVLALLDQIQRIACPWLDAGDKDT
jgi:ABC-type nitrate/sulfonate/bicarbonate transport system permease component